MNPKNIPMFYKAVYEADNTNLLFKNLPDPNSRDGNVIVRIAKRNLQWTSRKKDKIKRKERRSINNVCLLKVLLLSA
jgi:hypothetical protein